MGKWDHRPNRNRKFFHQEKLPSPTPLPFHPQPPSLSEFRRDGIPQWEKEYCTLIGSIPWWKIVEAKNQMYSSSNVLNWDDSAGEEAFQNAKSCFWADINSLQCDISLPAPDIYIDEIDWNPVIDPDIMKEVDREYFCPDDEGNDELGQKKRKTEHSSMVPLDGKNCLPDTLTNPWECDNMQSCGNSQTQVQGWNQGNKHISLVNGDDNPWERGITQSNERRENPAWEDNRDNSWRSSQMGKSSLTKNWDDGGNPWARDSPSVTHAKDCNGWANPLNKSWGSNQLETKNSYNGKNPWVCDPSQSNEASMNDRGWRDGGGEERHWKRCQRNNLDCRIKSNGRGARNDGGQKRGHSHQYIAGYQNSRLEGGDCQTGGYWRRENNRKRFS
ncbi:uncharacterized protein LOC126802703 [Argentina anserina]|uniref:uncharacterized protein LOC126802703 n=1 Tax=Argentina anserina TaxID=57926 RepID=UPI0021764F54|nr:uncharacterized protein LOC126802703 [Potentilla anserina]